METTDECINSKLKAFLDTVRTDSIAVAECNAFCNCIYVLSSEKHIVTNKPIHSFLDNVAFTLSNIRYHKCNTNN